MALSGELRTKAEQLIIDGQLSSEEIAAQLGLTRQQVAAVKAWINIREGKGSSSPETETENLIEEAVGISFSLERDMQLALRAKLEQLEPGLQIADGGKEQVVSFGGNAIGRIDITARDRDGAVVVIELKAGKAAPESLTQLLSYMGALASPNQKQVRGILIANDFHDKVIFGASAVPNVLLRQYSFRFSFNEISKAVVSETP